MLCCHAMNRAWIPTLQWHLQRQRTRIFTAMTLLRRILFRLWLWVMWWSDFSSVSNVTKKTGGECFSIPFLYHYMQSLTWCSVRLFCLYDHMECVLSYTRRERTFMSIYPLRTRLAPPTNSPQIIRLWIPIWQINVFGRAGSYGRQNVSTLLRYSP